MTSRVVSLRPRTVLGAGCALIVLFCSVAPVAAQPAAGGDEPVEAPPPPPPPPPPQLLTVGPAADSVKEKLSYETPKEDVLSMNLSAGGAFAFGNTRAYQLAAGGDFRWVGRPHSVSANVLYLVGGAKPPQGDEVVTTTENLNGRAKYEIFLSLLDSLYAAAGVRYDRFAGMRPRVNGQVGYGHYFVSEEKVRFWGEIGYDLMFTHYRQIPGATMRFEDDEVVHSARLFVGLEHQLHDFLTYVGGLEGFLNVEEPGASRFVFDSAIRSTLSNSFKLELKARFLYEARPVVPNAEKLDTALILSLLYSVI
jgi:hypothetical protein